MFRELVNHRGRGPAVNPEITIPGRNVGSRLIYLNDAAVRMLGPTKPARVRVMVDDEHGLISLKASAQIGRAHV